MRIYWTPFLCVAVTLMAAAGSADEMDREQQMMAVVEGQMDDGEMERHMEAESEAVESIALQMEEAKEMEEGELVEENGTPFEEKWKIRNSGCPSGWEQYGKRCFIYVAKERTWTESERYCISRGGNLASVHSVAEHYFVQDVIRWLTHDFPRTWIGGYDATQEGMWLWSDGTSLDNAIWGPGQPDNVGASQHCLQMNHGDTKRWDDAYCTDKLPSVCAMRI